MYSLFYALVCAPYLVFTPLCSLVCAPFLLIAFLFLQICFSCVQLKKGLSYATSHMFALYCAYLCSLLRMWDFIYIHPCSKP